MREVVIVALAAFLIGIMAAALLVHFLRGEAAAMSAPASRLGQSRNRNSLDCGFGQNRLKAALPPSSVLPTG
jgi:hypothetical protein